ncbi:MAG: DUF2270 domain-containing protein [Spirochaetaceae bacterium]|nr:MAG: DUF2270 domain-containing protein [Spirochaetaceae bacterium]
MSSEPDALPPIAGRDYYTTMSHFYRGELGRALVWRQRLDATTNWAILAATGVITFALGSETVSHIVFMLANMLVFLLLMIEGRRYRYYDAYRARVRILEAHFLVPVVTEREIGLQGDWRKVLAEDLLIPSFKMGLRRAIGRRLNQNYFWVFLVILASHMIKIFLHSSDVSTVTGFVRALSSDQPLPQPLYWVVFVGFYALLVYLYLLGRRPKGFAGEFSRRTPNPQSWTL